MKRQILEVSGTDAAKFLGDLVTNALPSEGALTYAALLSPQGKYLADFFLLKRGDAYWVDVDAGLAAKLAQRLTMYRLRADVTIAPLDVAVATGLSDAPASALPDPRHPDMGWRDYDGAAGHEVDWDALRVAHIIPQTGVELIPDDSYILEMGFERLNGVDFKKGCYVGQEVTARMKHKTELRKGLARVSLSDAVPVGSTITAGDKEVGTIFTQSRDQALAYIRFDRAKGVMQAGSAEVTLDLIP